MRRSHNCARLQEKFCSISLRQNRSPCMATLQVTELSIYYCLHCFKESALLLEYMTFLGYWITAYLVLIYYSYLAQWLYYVWILWKFLQMQLFCTDKILSCFVGWKMLWKRTTYFSEYSRQVYMPLLFLRSNTLLCTYSPPYNNSGLSVMPFYYH